VYKHVLGGGFGRRGQQDYVRQAVAIGKQFPGVPVKLIGSRGGHDARLLPADLASVARGTDAAGNQVLYVRVSTVDQRVQQ
jgi:isoquinoline 1-oxidoreductase beta subunit